MSHTKFLFLDIDGVLNHSKWLTDHAGAIDEAHTLTGPASIDPECVKRVDEICRRTGALIVISSSWRLDNTVDYLQKVLRQCGLTAEVIDKTPEGISVAQTDDLVKKFLESGDVKNLDRMTRGHEIQRWMDGNGYTNVDHIVILDDDPDMAHLLPRLVQTDDGIEDKHVERAVELLGERPL